MRRGLGRTVAAVVLLLAGILYLSPFYIVVVNSFKNRAQISLTPLALPPALDFQYYRTAISKMSLDVAIQNSLIITLVSIFFLVLFAASTAWLMVRRPSRLSKLLFYSLVATMIIPFQSLMMPLMLLMGSLNRATGIPFLNSYFGLIYMNAGFGLGMSVFLYHGFVKSIPLSIEEAATLDGCGTWSLFGLVVFPMLKTITMTVIILNVIWIWNDFLLPSLVLSSKGLRTIPLSTYSFFGEFTIQWNLAMAGLTLTILPVIVFYILAQRYIISGVVTGAIKQ